MGRSVCILGKSGIGKTWAVADAYQGRVIDLNADILKTKQKTIDFLERARSSDLPVVIDEYEALCDLVGLWEIKEPPSQGQFIIISQIPVKFDFPIADLVWCVFEPCCSVSLISAYWTNRFSCSVWLCEGHC